ncbi:hypothetical protein HYPSUDRAFT_989657 [Hypholoma sublateritium FD-334 SS-4]|uniref:Uncharacterized protein n=1 Tax=Hypholoma sublateritium (strain FD-334 SS-4) TaxID=945553 RepID=A0A0D2Q6C0_HYPSF|nr:hypothetical protein HYPSUDRAFT_989657 [Hypholoma sublateritium FD-334 SS-4]
MPLGKPWNTLVLATCTSHGEPAHGVCSGQLLVFLVPRGNAGKHVNPAQERRAVRRPSTAQDIRTSRCRASSSWAPVGVRLIDVFARPVNRSPSSFWNLMVRLDENSAAARRRISISASFRLAVNIRAHPFNGNPKHNSSS